MSNEPESTAARLAALMASMNDLWGPVQEAVIGYRNKLVDLGMGKDAADQCAADYHRYLMDLLPRGGKGFGGKS